MKKYFIIIFTLILLTACSEAELTASNEPSEEVVQTEIIDTTTTTPPPKTTTTPPQTAATPLPEPEPLTEMEELALFVENFNSMNVFFSFVPVFNNINEVPIYNFIKLYQKNFDHEYTKLEYFDFEYTEEQIKKFSDAVPYNEAYGVYPNTIEKYIQETYNINFRVEHYDFKVGMSFGNSHRAIWDEENNSVVFIPVYSGGGGYSRKCTMLKTYKEDDVYYAVTVDYGSSLAELKIEGYYLNTVKKNENGNFNIISKQPIDINNVSFNKEELEIIKQIDDILIGDKFIISVPEAQAIMQDLMPDILNNIISDEELYCNINNAPLWDGGDPDYYHAHIRYDVYNDEGRLSGFTTVKLYYIDKVTGKVYLYNIETKELTPQ